MSDKDKIINQGQQAQNLYRIGEVVSRGTKKGTVRVQFKDTDELVSFDLQVIQRSTLKDKNYKIPDIGEQVACLFSANGPEEGVVLGCLYNDKDKPPVDSGDVEHITFEDGTVLEYDRAAHKLTVDVQGDIEIHATGSINIKADGPVKINGSTVDLNL
jgi:phage baseplate assembly protein V